MSLNDVIFTWFYKKTHWINLRSSTVIFFWLLFYQMKLVIIQINYHYTLTLPVFPIIWNSERCSKTIDRKYGKIAKRSTRFMGSMKNLIFLGEQANLTTYSMVKYTAVNASTQTIAAITCSLPVFSRSG